MTDISKPWGWWICDKTSEETGFFSRQVRHLSIAVPAEEWEITPLFSLDQIREITDSLVSMENKLEEQDAVIVRLRDEAEYENKLRVKAVEDRDAEHSAREKAEAECLRRDKDRADLHEKLGEVKRALNKVEENLNLKPEIDRRALAQRLLPLYKDDRVAIAQLCDTVLDPSGALLGYVRDAEILSDSAER